jgi:hypothetical protein
MAETPLAAGQYKVVRDPWILAYSSTQTIFIKKGGIIKVTLDGQTTPTIQGKTTADGLTVDGENKTIPAGTKITFSRGTEALPAVSMIGGASKQNNRTKQNRSNRKKHSRKHSRNRF